MTEPQAPETIRRISDVVPYWAARRDLGGEREAIVFGERRISYAELHRDIDRCARALLGSGVEKGDRLALLAASRPEFLTIFLAAARIGAVWVGLNPKYRLEELAYVVGDCLPTLLMGQVRVGDRDFTSDLETLERRTDSVERLLLLGGADGDRLLDFEAFLAEGDAVADDRLASAVAAVEPEDVCLVVYTSGSTGRPKGAMLTHQGLCLAGGVQAGRRRASTPVRIVNNFPINHIACTGNICCYALMAGGTMVFQEAFDPAATLAAIERERCNIWGGVPTMFQLCAALADFDRYDLSSVEWVAWGGAAAPKALLERLQGLGARLGNAYGMSETGGWVTYSDDDADLDTLADTIGRPDPHYQVRVVKADGTDCAPGEEGELQVRGDLVMRGYLNRLEATAEALGADGWLHTGDLATPGADGNLRLIGRLSEMYKSGGYNVYPREIELALEQHPAVAMAAVVGVPDPLYQEVGHAYLLQVPGTSVTADDLRRFCRQRLANYKIPKRLLLLSELPMLPVGKVDKVALARRAREQLTVSNEEVSSEEVSSEEVSSEEVSRRVAR